MRYVVKMGDVIVGRSDLERRDDAMRVAWGPFQPEEGYSLVEPIFRLWSEATAVDGVVDDEIAQRYYKARDRLGLILTDDAGARISITGLHIVNHSSDDHEPDCELTVYLATQLPP